MTHGRLQYAVGCPVIDRQIDAELFNFDIAHNTCAGHVKQLEIACLARLGQHKRIALIEQLFVVGSGFVKQPVDPAVVKLADGLFIAGNRTRAVQRVPVVADAWVQQQGQSRDEDQKQKQGCLFRFHATFSLLL